MKKPTCLSSRFGKPSDRDIDSRLTAREQFEKSFGANLNRIVVPVDVVDLCFDAWLAGRRMNVSADFESADDSAAKTDG
ncbi:hypothetical protein [Paraburkholderia caribensis]|uniref:hypothetical protein n=1 Tax=Paraburkholderia caribensis TaxID=75105 RepID=UPI001CC6548D|nr:hypothetical protein [Paraburkholderia caribensis]